MTFLTPIGALAALAALLVLGAWVYGRGRAEGARRTLGLAPPSGARRVRPLVAAAAIAALGLAAAQPALTRESRARVRTDAEALFVLDTSRSMAASRAPTSATRLDRAVAAAVRLRAAIPDVPAGVATLTDRVLPDLLPVADAAGFDAVVEHAVAIESPPPRETAPRATSFAALGELASGNYFEPSSKLRIVVLLTDGESNAIDPGAIADELSPARGYRFLTVRFWSARESVFRSNGRPEAAYRPDPLGRVILESLAAATGGNAFEEGKVAAAAARLRQAAGSGPTGFARGVTRSRRPLAPYVAGLGLLLLVLALAPFPGGFRVVESIAR